MKSQEWLTQLSQLTGLPYYQQHKVFEDKAGALIGERDGYLVALGLGTAGGKKQCAVKMLLRYGTSENAKPEDALKAARGKFSLLTVSDDTAVAARTYSLGKPEPKETADTLVNMLAALKASAPGIAGKCEHCKGT